MNAKKFLTMLMMLLPALLATAWADPNGTSSVEKNYIYKTNFSVGKDGWRGRAGYGAGSPMLEIVDNPTARGNQVLKIMTDGNLGCGFQFSVPADLVPGKDYKLSFKIRSASPEALTARITKKNFAEDGEDVPGWFAVPKNEQSQWRVVEHFFSPTSPKVGIEIAVSSKTYEPFELILGELTLEAQ